MSGKPIADYALLSDRHSAALVAKDGSVDWLCFPRFDSRSVFGALLDAKAGHWSIRPSEPYTIRRRYVPGSLVLESTFETEHGTIVLRDAMALAPPSRPRLPRLKLHPDEMGHHLGREAPHVVVRVLECTAGEVEIELDFEPRTEYGLTTPIMVHAKGGARTLGGPDDLVLAAPQLELECGDGFSRGRRRLRTGEHVSFAVQWQPEILRDAQPWTDDQIRAALAATVKSWQEWDGLHRGYDGPYADQVRFSGRVLKALGYEPSGAIVAAATTSLPEAVGEARNWDYRYAWIRDASLTLQGMWVAACPREAGRFFGWMVNAAGAVVKGGTPIQIMYGIGGERDLSERSLSHLAGWRDSRPVRIGNAAWTQVQLDVYGELLNSAWVLRDVAGPYNGLAGHLLAVLADDAAARWREPDNGIWEMRGEPRHFVASKVMCWVALDRAIQMADHLDATAEQLEHWRREVQAIRQAVCREGWNAELGSFTQSFGSKALDAANLMLALYGFLPADDPKLIGTVEAVADKLTRRGYVDRYRAADGLEGEEGSFLICTFWLANALARIGQVDRAREVFERAAGCANDLGLLSEEVDPTTSELLGNFPQAFSHTGLINAAWSIHQAEQAGRGEVRSPCILAARQEALIHPSAADLGACSRPV